MTNAVSVFIDKGDLYKEELCRDLDPNWNGMERIDVEEERQMHFQKDMTDKELDSLLTLCAASPYGAGYEVWASGKGRVW